MNGDNVVIIIEGGVVQTVYSDNANILATVVDLDERKLVKVTSTHLNGQTLSLMKMQFGKLSVIMLRTL